MSARSIRLAVLALLLALAGCGPGSGLELRKYTNSEILQLGWAKQDLVVTEAPRYCYKTLADVDCYTQPQPGQEYRYIAPYAPVPKVTVLKPAAD